VGGHHEVVPELRVIGLLQRQLVQRRAHVPQPGVAFCLPDGEVHVPHPQPGVTAPLAVGAGAAPVLNEEKPQVLLGRAEILAGVNRAELRIPRDATVERAHQAAERLLAAHCLIKARLC
jgi:hypothetical protein